MSEHTSDCTAVHFHDNPTDTLQHMAHTHEKTLFGSTTRRGARLAVRPNYLPPLNQEVCADNWYYPEDKCNNVLRMECVEPGEMWRVQSSRHGTDPKRRIKKRSQFSRKKSSVSLSPFEEIDNLERHASGRKQSGRCSGRKR